MTTDKITITKAFNTVYIYRKRTWFCIDNSGRMLHSFKTKVKISDWEKILYSGNVK